MRIHLKGQNTGLALGRIPREVIQRLKEVGMRAAINGRLGSGFGVPVTAYPAALRPIQLGIGKQILHL